MKAFDVSSAAANVGPAQNNLHTVVVNDAFYEDPIGQVVVVKNTGSCATYDVIASTDPNVGQGSEDLRKRIAKWTGATPTVPVRDDNTGMGFAWNAHDPATAGTVYLWIVPNAGNDNKFDIRLNMRRRA